MAHKQSREESKDAAKQTGMDPIVYASVASIALSQYFFFMKGDRELGIFIGLWPPTFMALASYFRQAEMYQMLQQGSSGVVAQVQKMLQNQ